MRTQGETVSTRPGERPQEEPALLVEPHNPPQSLTFPGTLFWRPEQTHILESSGKFIIVSEHCLLFSPQHLHRIISFYFSYLLMAHDLNNL